MRAIGGEKIGAYAQAIHGCYPEGNLISVERPEGESKPKVEDTYAYNGDGLRASQTISGTTSYVTWDTAEELPLLLNDGTNSYIYGPGGLPVEQISSGGTTTYLHHDQQGSTRLLTNAAGETVGSTTYDAYGDLLGSSGSETSALGYDGQYTDADTGLVYLRARYYDPQSAQFLSVDPDVESTLAPYSYVSDSPLGSSDPSGLLEVELPELPCVWPICGPLPSVVEGEERLGKTVIEVADKAAEEAARVVHTIEGGERSGGQLKRESEAILGRGHKTTPARTKKWNEWYEKLTPRERKEFAKAGGNKPRKSN